MQLSNLSAEHYLTDKYALWLDFRTIDENVFHGTGRKIGSTRGGINLQIAKSAESVGALKVYICILIMDAQLNIQNRAFDSTTYQENKKTS